MNMTSSFSAEIPAGWDNLVQACPWGSFYQGTRNLEIINQGSPARVVLAAVRGEDGSLIGGLALGVQEGPLGKVVNALPYFGSYGDALLMPGAPAEIEAGLYHSALEYARAIDALCLTVITSPFAEAAHHQKVQRWVEPTFVDERCCQVAHLPEYGGEGQEQYRERIMGSIEKRARTAYRKVVKTGMTLGRAETEAEVLEFAAVHHANIGGKGGVFKTEAFFRLIYGMSRAAPGEAELAVVRDGEKFVGGVVLFRFRDTVEYHTTALREEYRSIGPLNQIIVESMVRDGMTGTRYWNFGGTWKSQSGVYMFKQSFGAQDHAYFYFTRFFRDLERIKQFTPEEVVTGYPLCFVIPFSELGGSA
jgi:hypothetical protein